MRLSVNRRRKGVSELMGTLIMIAITLVAGAAAFGWVNGQAATSESAYGASAAQGANYLREHFAVVTSTFTGPGGIACNGSPPTCTVANFWVFNNGQLAFSLSTLSIQSAPSAPSANKLNIVFTPSGFTAYNSGGAQLSCSPSTPGFGIVNPIPIGTLSQTPYSVTIPTACNGVNPIVVGQGYVITLTGQFGNIVQFQVTANG